MKIQTLYFVLCIIAATFSFTQLNCGDEGLTCKVITGRPYLIVLCIIKIGTASLIAPSSFSNVIHFVAFQGDAKLYALSFALPDVFAVFIYDLNTTMTAISNVYQLSNTYVFFSARE